MNDVRLTDTRVGNLEWVFSPPGLLVPERIAGTTPTTSCVVRGAAGTGKTTLALGLAVTLADGLGGVVYYLSTEIAPTDVRFKLGHLGLRPDALAARSAGTTEARILSEHLALVSDADLEPPGARTRATFDHVEQLVLDGTLPKLRVVVIDAFALVGESEITATMRARLAAMIQAFDALGVSVVLVEEAPVTGADWVSFVVDLVFELRWGADPDTGAAIRQLAVPKSRFVPAQPGPHDYGLDEGRLAVWPDLATVDAGALGARLGGRGGGVIDEDGVPIFGLVGVVLSDGGGLEGALRRTPWLRGIDVQMSGTVKVSNRYTVPSWEGPTSIVWAIVKCIIADSADVVFISSLEYALSRQRFRSRLFGDLQVLSSLGVVVLLHGSDSELTRVPAAFNYAEGGREVFPLSTAWWLPRLAGTDADLVQAIHQFWTAPPDRPVPPPIVRGWAVAQAYRAGDARALDWLLQRPPLPDERPFVRHALARSRRWAAARGLLPAGPTDLREQLEAELHLGLFTEAGLAKAAKTYERLLADPSVPDERKDLMREQLEAVRTALTGPPATSDPGSPGGRRRRPGR